MKALQIHEKLSMRMNIIAVDYMKGFIFRLFVSVYKQ